MANINQKLLNKVLQIVRNYAETACNQVETEWSRYSADYVEGDSVINSDVTAAKTQIIATIYAYGQRAWILEFGRGSKMDDAKTNPFLQDYLKNPKLNPWRKARGNNAIYGRPAGQYEDLDGHPLWSNGKWSGVNIEDVRHKGELPYRPLKGEHIINNILFGGESGLDKLTSAFKGTPPKTGIIADMLNDINNETQLILSNFLTNALPKQIKLTKRR